MASLGAAHLFKACCIVGTGRHSGLLLCVLAIQQWVLDGEVQVEADLADLPTSVAVVEDHDIVAVDYTTPGEPGT